MTVTHVTADGYTIIAYSSAYLDYGLKIQKDGETLYYSPCCLSNDSYGHSHNLDLFDSWEEAEASDHPEAFIPWGESEWKSCLEDEADDLIEAYVPEAN